MHQAKGLEAIREGKMPAMVHPTWDLQSYSCFCRGVLWGVGSVYAIPSLGLSPVPSQASYPGQILKPYVPQFSDSTLMFGIEPK